MECRIERALFNMTEERRCIPWFYPPLDGDTRLCSPFEAEEFKSSIEFMSPNDCEVWLKDEHSAIDKFNVWNISSTVYPTVKRLDTLQACQLQSSIDATQNWWDPAPCAACPRLWLEIRQRDFPLVTFPCGAQVLWMTTGKNMRQTHNTDDSLKSEIKIDWFNHFVVILVWFLQIIKIASYHLQKLW